MGPAGEKMLENGYKEYTSLGSEELDMNGWFSVDFDPSDEFITEKSIYHQRPFTFEEFVDRVCTDKEFEQRFFKNQSIK